MESTELDVEGEEELAIATAFYEGQTKKLEKMLAADKVELGELLADMLDYQADRLERRRAKRDGE